MGFKARPEKVMTVEEAEKALGWGKIYKKGYNPDCYNFKPFTLPYKGELPKEFIIEVLDGELTFELLEITSKIFKTKKINVVSETEHGYYGETYRKLLLEVDRTK